jgi:hypothetical protein
LSEHFAEGTTRWWGWLGIASGCICLSGHPQLPIYALAAASLYALCRGWALRGGTAILVMMCGAGLASFALYPMFLLTRRSTRVLDLAAANNDISLPFQRLISLVVPSADGYPARLGSSVPFSGYPNEAYFWDTVGYVGLLPWLGLVVLVILVCRRVVPIGAVGYSFALISCLSLILAVNPIQSWMAESGGGMFLRSSARLLYLVSFALAIGLAGTLSIAIRYACHRQNVGLLVVIGLASAGHLADLGTFARKFTAVMPLSAQPSSDEITSFRRGVGEGRIAFDLTLSTVPMLNRVVDDVGFFDSVMLARPYRFLLGTSGADPKENTQILNGSRLSARTLEAAGVRYVYTGDSRGDLPLVSERGALKVYATAAPAERAKWYASSQVRWEQSSEIHRLQDDPTFSLGSLLLLPKEFGQGEQSKVAEGPQRQASKLIYTREHSDRISRPG